MELRGTFVFSVLRCGATARNDAANGTSAQPPVLAAPLLQLIARQLVPEQLTKAVEVFPPLTGSNYPVVKKAS